MNNKSRIKIVSISLIVILLIVGLPMVFDLGSEHATVKAAPIIVDKGGGGNYTTIQEAIDNASAGDTIYVWAGTYYENVVVNRSLTIIGNGLSNTTIDASGGSNAVIVTVDWVNISGFAITNCTHAGIILEANHSKIEACSFSSSDIGIKLSYSESNTIINTTMISCGLYIEGDQVQHWNTHEIAANNTVNGKPVHYWKDATSGTIPSGAGQVILANCKNINVKGQNFESATVSIELGFSSENSIENIHASSNTDYGIYLYHSNNNTLKSNTCDSNLAAGIYLDSSNDNLINSNTVSENGGSGIFQTNSDGSEINDNDCNSNNVHGIHLDSSSDSTINGNTAENNDGKGIYLEGSSNNIISDSTVKASNRESGHCIYLDGSNSNTISGNTVSRTGWRGIYLGASSSNSIIGNTVSDTGCGIQLGSQSNSNTIIDNKCKFNGNGVTLDSSNSNTIENNDCTNNEGVGISVWGGLDNQFKNNDCSNTGGGYFFNKGMELLGSNGNTIENCIFNSNAHFGLYLDSSSNNIISKNTVSRNDLEGIYIKESTGNNITGNTVTYNGDNYEDVTEGTLEAGIYLSSSSGHILEDNTCSNNDDYGIYLSKSYDNNITNNIATSNNGAGIELFISDSNILVGNTCSENWRGIRLSSSSNNLVYHNNLIDNDHQATDLNTNLWNLTYPGGGNYWSDYTGVDENNDGIGDIPYYIEGSYGKGKNQDNFPLMSQDVTITPDTTPPTIFSTIPEQDSKKVAVNITPTLTFSESMDTSVNNSAIEISPVLDCELSWPNNMKNLIIVFTNDLMYNTTYTITITTKFTDIVGNPLEESYSWYFKTEELDTDNDGLTDDVDPDDDNDGANDESDHFPIDPAASLDMDGDGYPDKWNQGRSETDSTTGLKLDQFPLDPEKWVEADNGDNGDNINATSSGEAVLSFSDINTLEIILTAEIIGSDASLFRSIMDMDENGIVTSQEVETFEDFMVEFSLWGASQDSGITLDEIQGILTITDYEIEGAEGDSTSTEPFSGHTHMKVTFIGIDKNTDHHILNMTLFDDTFTFELTSPKNFRILEASGLDNLMIDEKIISGTTSREQDISITFEKHMETSTEKDTEWMNVFIFIFIIIIVIIIISVIFMKKKSKKIKPTVKPETAQPSQEVFVQPLSTDPFQQSRGTQSPDVTTDKYLESGEISYGHYEDQYQSLYGNTSTEQPPEPQQLPSQSQPRLKSRVPKIKSQ